MTCRGFETVLLDAAFTSESVACGDFNRDGHPDIVAGPWWYEGPSFRERHAIFEPAVFDPHGYSRTTQPCFVNDFNDDGWPDVFYVVRRPGPKDNYGFYGWGEARGWEGIWYENPAGRDRPWTPHRVLDNIANEAVVWADVNGDGRPELVHNNREAYGYAAFDPAAPDRPWAFHPISPPSSYTLGQGIGAGDVTGNGRLDILGAGGWWESPADAEDPWEWHTHEFARNAANIEVCDVDGDGLPDIVTVHHAHGYGLLWYRQARDASGAITWEPHEILPVDPDAESDAPRISQLHALAVGDLDGDGLPDIVVGKRHWAHGPHGDPEPDAPPVLYWFQLQRSSAGPRFVPHLVSDECGAGTQIALADLNGNGRPDIVTSSKRGTYVHLNRL